MIRSFRQKWHLLLLLLSALSAVACGDGPSEPSPGIGRFEAELAGAFEGPMRGSAVFYVGLFNPGVTPTFTLRLDGEDGRGLILYYWPTRQQPPAPGRYRFGVACGAEDNWCNDGVFLVHTFGFGSFVRIEAGEVVLTAVSADRIDGSFELAAFTATDAQNTDARRYTAVGLFNAVPRQE